jgi:hypothetical protein
MASLLGLLALFLVISARDGAGLNLWGDEAYSLNVAAKSVRPNRWAIFSLLIPFTCQPITCYCSRLLAFSPG